MSILPQKNFVSIPNCRSYLRPAFCSSIYARLAATGFFGICRACLFALRYVGHAGYFCLIPDSVLFPLIAITLAFRLLEVISSGWNFALLINYVLAAVLASGFFLAIFLVSKGRWMGFGDVKLAFFMGLGLGLQNVLVALFLAFLLGAIIGVFLMLLKSKNLKSEVPFAPFLLIGTFVALFFGNVLASWYISMILP